MNNNWMNGFGSKANCHTGNPVVFTVDGVAIHAGGHTRNGGYHVMSPAPDLAIGPAQVMDRSSNRTVAPDGFTCGNHVDGASSHIISIDWPDFSIPQDVGREFWVALVDDIKRLGIKTVSTQCVGGHGRTGVQLCILGYLMGDAECLKQPDAASLIEYVRSIYCHHAVEGKSQQQYVADILGIPMGKSLFQSFSGGNKFNFVEDKPKPKNAPKIYFEEDDWDDEQGFPDSWDVYSCPDCGHYEWLHADDSKLKKDFHCDSCGCPDMMLATDGLYNMTDICPKCDNTISTFAEMKDGVCLCCYTEDNRKAKVQDDKIQCRKCKKFVLPEFIDMDTQMYHCHDCIRKTRIKAEERKKKGKNKAKNYPAKKKKSKKQSKQEIMQRQADDIQSILDEWR